MRLRSILNKLIDRKEDLEIELQRKEEQLVVIQDEKLEIKEELSEASRLIFRPTNILKCSFAADRFTFQATKCGTTCRKLPV